MSESVSEAMPPLPVRQQSPRLEASIIHAMPPSYRLQWSSKLQKGDADGGECHSLMLDAADY
jgi:hypothetical protein